MNEIIENVLNHSLTAVPSAVVGAVVGFFVKGSLENRKNKKKLKEKSIEAVKETNSVISSLNLQIGRDIRMYIHTTKILKDEADVNKPFLNDYKEMIELSKVRLSENCKVIIDLSVSDFKKLYPEAAEEIKKFQKTCRDLKRIVEIKTIDNQKLSLLEKIDKEIMDHYQKIMDATRSVY
ncbi:hypothetical protein ACW2QC_07555 [Virgibacillus sp. FSP13]